MFGTLLVLHPAFPRLTRGLSAAGPLLRAHAGSAARSRAGPPRRRAGGELHGLLSDGELHGDCGK